MDRKRLEKQILTAKREIARLGPLRPGTLYKQKSVCGKPGCRCSRSKKPERHGPYHYLSYTFEGRSYTEFVPAGELSKAKEQIRNYTRLMKLVGVLVRSGIELARLRKAK